MHDEPFVSASGERIRALLADARNNVRSAIAQLVTSVALLITVLFFLNAFYEVSWRYRPPSIIGRLMTSEIRFLAWAVVLALILYMGMLYPLLIKSFREVREANELLARTEHGQNASAKRHFRA